MVEPKFEVRIGSARRRWLGLRCAPVSVVESAEVRSGDDFAETVLDGTRLGCVALDLQGASGLIVVDLVVRESLEQMALAKRDDAVSAFTPDGSDDALDVRILPRRFPGTDHLFDSHGLCLPKTLSAASNPHESGRTTSRLAHI
jgi:hypothetical protein